LLYDALSRYWWDTPGRQHTAFVTRYRLEGTKMPLNKQDRGEGVPVNSMEDVVALARKHPGKHLVVKMKGPNGVAEALVTFDSDGKSFTVTCDDEEIQALVSGQIKQHIDPNAAAWTATRLPPS
jgi:hypothetical protein